MVGKKTAPKKSTASKKTATTAKKGVKKKTIRASLKKQERSAIRIKCNVGYGNNLFIRGEGPGLSWMQGVLLTNIAPDEWIWETSEPFDRCEFKVLVNDKDFEAGENHRLPLGAIVQYTPCF